MADLDEKPLDKRKDDQIISEAQRELENAKNAIVLQSPIEAPNIEEIEIKQISLDQVNEVEVRKKSVNETSRLMEAVKSFTETEINYGLIYKMFRLCCPSNTAVFLFIFVSLVLNTSDAFSDLALAVFLYTR